MILNKWLPLAVPILAWLSLEAVLLRPDLVYVSAVFVLLLQFFAARQFTLKAARDSRWWQAMILPASLSAALLAFATLLPQPGLVHLLFLANAVFLYLYWRNLYYYLIDTENYRSQSLENLAAYGNFVSIYFLASFIYGLQVFINADTWLLMILLLGFVFLSAYQVLWSNGVLSHQAWPYILIVCVLMLETAWALSFMTLSYYILGLVVAVVFYMAMGLIRFYLRGSLSPKAIRLYLISGFVSILVVLFTANWISHN